MGTFLGSYRLEKRSKSHGVSENFIIIGIPIQMEILKFRHGPGNFRSWSNASRARMVPLPGSKSAGRYLARRRVGEFQYFVRHHSIS